jgi:hypothetical protein
VNDRFDEQQLGERVRDSVARNVRRVSPRPDPDDLFVRVGARAARQRRTLAVSAVALVAVASLVGYAIGTNAGRDSARVAVAPGQQTEPPTTSSPADVQSGPLEYLFRRTVGGITVRVYTSFAHPGPDDSSGSIVAEISNDAAVDVARVENQYCPNMGLRASGTFGEPEGSPVQWAIVNSFDLASTTGIPVRAEFGSVADEMVPVHGISVLVAPGGAGGTVHVSGAGVESTTPVGQVLDDSMCAPPASPPTSTLPQAGPQPADVAAAEAGVRQAYVDVYDNYTPPNGNSNVNGDQGVQQALRDGGFTDEQLAAMTVEVGEIRFTDETHAAVLFRLTIPGHMDGTQGWRVGYAVFQDGRWTQAQETYCDDLRAINVDCP